MKLILIINESGFLDDNHAMIQEASNLCLIQHMRCAVHTLQLAIRNGLKKRSVASLISKFRQVAKAARTTQIDSILKKHSGMGAILDQETRWGSIFMMIKRLLDLKVCLEDLAKLTEFEAFFCYPFSVTKKFQSEDLTPGTFFLTWRELLFRLNRTGGMIAEEILLSMKRREELLLENTILLAAI